MKQLLRMADETFDSLEIARRDGRRQPAHAVAREQGADLMVEWVPGVRPGHGWLILDEPPGEDPTTTRLLQAEWHVYQVAHDARNQLAEIDAGLELLDEALAPAPSSDDQGSSSEVEPIGPAERERLHRTVALTRSACAAALEIIHDVHEETERAQRVRDLRKEVDLGELLRTTLAGYEPRAAARGVSVSEAMAPSIQVRADPSRLRRVLTNLVDNALQAMPEGGALRVSMAVDDRDTPGVLLEISDTGVGIAPERLELIFQPGETTTPGSKGRGLAIVHRFVLGCDGEIRCESVPGEGTTFHIWLPRIV
jgi:signal transduction histidine kinase